MPRENASSWALPFVHSFLILFLAATLLAQSERGTITGTVLDPGGAVVPGAALTLKSTATAATYQTVTTGTGNYTLPSLPSGLTSHDRPAIPAILTMYRTSSALLNKAAAWKIVAARKENDG